LKENIRQALQGARNYPDFEKKIQQKGYRLEKGRGIAFGDEKHAWIKGSEIGYSLAAIEKTLNRNRLLQNEQSLNQLPAHFKKPDGSTGLSKDSREEEQSQEIYRGRRIGR
jgi:hypothetical protein